MNIHEAHSAMRAGYHPELEASIVAALRADMLARLDAFLSGPVADHVAAVGVSEATLVSCGHYSWFSAAETRAILEGRFDRQYASNGCLYQFSLHVGDWVFCFSPHKESVGQLSDECSKFERLLGANETADGKHVMWSPRLWTAAPITASAALDVVDAETRSYVGKREGAVLDQLYGKTRMPPFDRVAYGKRLAFARNRMGISQGALALRIGWPSAVICHHERGRRSPVVASIIALCDALNVSADWLLGRTES